MCTVRRAQSTVHSAQSTEHRAQCTEYRAQCTVHRAQSTEHSAQSTEHRAQNTVHRVQRTEYRAQCTEHRAQCTEHRAQCTEHRAQSTVHRVQSTVHRVQSTVHSAQSTKHKFYWHIQSNCAHLLHFFASSVFSSSSSEWESERVSEWESEWVRKWVSERVMSIKRREFPSFVLWRRAVWCRTLLNPTSLWQSKNVSVSLKMEAQNFVDTAQSVWQFVIKHVAEVTSFISTAVVTLDFYTNSKCVVTERYIDLIML